MVLVSGCKDEKKAATAAGPQMMPVQTAAASLAPVPVANEYVGTIKSRRSATLQPQVDGRLTAILVHSGEAVKAGQPIVEIDPLHQRAAVDSARATELQKKALYDYNAKEVERQKKLFEAGITSRQAYEQEQQSYENAKADYESAAATRKTQEEELAYYTVRAPFAGVIGDVPVHVGDYATPSTMLTTVDEAGDLEAYVYVPTERASMVRNGLEVDVLDNTTGKTLETSRIDFVAPQVDSTLQGILVKAPVHATSAEQLRNAQIVKARVVWATRQLPVVPVLAVVRQAGQSFVYVVRQQNGMTIAAQTAVTLGDTVGNLYSVTAGLNIGDKVIISGTQFLVNGMPVMPLGK